MNGLHVPFHVGWQQVVLLFLAIIGIVLLITSITSLLFGSREVELLEDEEGRRFRRYRHRRRFRMGRGIGGLVLLLIAVVILWITSLVQTYLGLTDKIHVARVHAVPISNQNHLMSVELTLYDDNGNPTTVQTYEVKGDEWMVQGNILKFPGWMNILGFHSGFKLTRLEGRFDDPNMEANEKHTVVVLNGGDDNFFKTAQQQAWTNPFVEAAYGNAVFVRADSMTYDVYASQDALNAYPAK